MIAEQAAQTVHRQAVPKLGDELTQTAVGGERSAEVGRVQEAVDVARVVFNEHQRFAE